MLTLMISLMLSTAPPAGEKTTCYIDAGLGVAPLNAPLLLDLPPSVEVEGGLLVAKERARDVAWRMECLQRWPRACQITLDSLAQSHAAEIEEHKRVTREVAALRFDEQPSNRWPPWLVAIVAAGAGAAVGLSAGVLGVLALHH